MGYRVQFDTFWFDLLALRSVETLNIPENEGIETAVHRYSDAVADSMVYGWRVEMIPDDLSKHLFE